METLVSLRKEYIMNIIQKRRKKVFALLTAATSSLSKTMKEISTTQQELALAKVRENGQYELMKKRIKYIYESGSASLLSMLFESESMADLLNKAEFISTVSEYDRTMLEKLQTLHSSIAKKEKELRQQQKNFEKQKKDLEEKYEQLSSKITDTSNELNDYKNSWPKQRLSPRQPKAFLTKNLLKSLVNRTASRRKNPITNPLPLLPRKIWHYLQVF